MKLTDLKIGYLPLSKDLSAPGDRRRFSYYAQSRELDFEIADPSKKYDLVVLSQNADLSVWCDYDIGGAKIVYDLIDSYLAVPRTELKGRLRGIAKFVIGKSKYLKVNQWKAIESMCLRANAVVCSTEEQKLDIKPFCDNVHQILDVQSSVHGSTKKSYSRSKVFNIVWEGQADNVFQFNLLKPVLLELQKKYEIALHFVTDLNYKKFAGRYWKVQTKDVVENLCGSVFVYDWNELTCSKIITACDLAVIPIDLTNPLVRGKPENKLLLFWRLGMPVITSATPAYTRAMTAIDMEMTCNSQQDWHDKIENFILDQSLRERSGTSGRKYTLGKYSEEIILKEWDKVLMSCF